MQAEMTRAAKILDRCEAEAAKHGSMKYAAEAGLLRGEVQNLCAELDAFQPLYSKGYSYTSPLELEDHVFVIVGYTSSYGDLDITEVWLNGCDVSAVIKPELFSSLRDQVWDMVDAKREDLAAEVA